LGAMVQGMHRSGTSATTLALASVCAAFELPIDDFPASAENPVGYAESARLSRFNDGLLFRLGGSVMSPPKRPAGWPELLKSHASTAPAEAVRVFSQSFPTRGWIWKDPRLCLLSEYWDPLLLNFDGLVIVFRHPNEVVQSLMMRLSSFSATNERGIVSLWQSYVVSSLEAAQSMNRTVFVSNYNTLINNRVAWLGQARSFLEALEYSPRRHHRRALDRVVRPGLQHNRVAAVSWRADSELSDCKELYRLLCKLEGVHVDFGRVL
jgi:hypothetical protein